MRKIRDVLRLYFTAALSIRAIARSLGTSPSTVGEYLRRAKVAGLSWPVPESVDDTGLERRLFPPPPPDRTARPLPDWSEVHRELRRKSVTLALLWQEYKEAHPEGLQYSWFCDQYRAWAGKLDLVMRQDHRAGEKLFVDYAGQTVPVVDRETARTVECFHRSQRVASHVRSPHRGRHTTAAEHMPEKHRRMGDWTPDRFIDWAGKIGPDTVALVTAVLARRHPQRAYRSCIGLQRLAKCYGDARLEAAAARALAVDSCSGEPVVGLSGCRGCRLSGCRVVGCRCRRCR